MSDRYQTMIVTLRRPSRTEDLEHLLAAIGMMAPVARVSLGTKDSCDLEAAQSAVAADMVDVIRNVLGAWTWRHMSDRWANIKKAAEGK